MMKKHPTAGLKSGSYKSKREAHTGRFVETGSAVKGSFIVSPLGRAVNSGANSKSRVSIEVDALVFQNIKEADSKQLELYAELVVDRVEDRFATRAEAFQWFRSVPLPGWGEATAEQLVAGGKVAQVIETIDAINAGVHA